MLRETPATLIYMREQGNTFEGYSFVERDLSLYEVFFEKHIQRALKIEKHTYDCKDEEEFEKIVLNEFEIRSWSKAHPETKFILAKDKPTYMVELSKLVEAYQREGFCIPNPINGLFIGFYDRVREDVLRSVISELLQPIKRDNML